MPTPPPKHQLQRRLHTCPHTGSVRVALTRSAPVPPDTDVCLPGAACVEQEKSFGDVLLRLHATKCNARVRQLPRHRLPTVAATAKAGTGAMASASDSAAAVPARPTSREALTCRLEQSRRAARTLSAEQARGTAVSVAQEAVDNALEACIADFGFKIMLAHGETRVRSAHLAVRSARVHDGCGYVRHAKERLIARMKTQKGVSNHSLDSYTERTPHAGANLPNSYMHHTPPREWGFATRQTAESHAVTPRAFDAQRQRNARRHVGLPSAMGLWAISDTGGGDGTAAAAAALTRRNSPTQSLAAKVAARKRVPGRGDGILTVRVWAPQSTPDTRRVPDPVARPFLFAGTNPFPATARDHYDYPTVPNHYHLAVEIAADRADGNSGGSPPLEQADYTSVQLEQLNKRRVIHVSHTEAAHAVHQLLRDGTSSRWVQSASGRVVVATPTKENASNRLGGVLPVPSVGCAWAAAIEHPLTERDYLHSRGGVDERRRVRLERPLTVRHLLSAGAIKQNVC